MILGQLAESCTRGESVGGAGAVFALVGERRIGRRADVPGETGPEDHLVVRAQSGEAAWAHSVNGGPLEPLWRKAVENRRIFGAETDGLPLAKDVSRFVAIPVEEGGSIVAVLLAGLPKRTAAVEAVDRLGWRGALAGEVLGQERRIPVSTPDPQSDKSEDKSGREAWETVQQAIEGLEEGVVVFDAKDRILARNGMFLQLLGLSEETATNLVTFDDVIRAATRNATEPQQFAAEWRALKETCAEETREELAMERPVKQKIERWARPIVGPKGQKLSRVEVYRGMSTWRVFQSKMAQTERLASLGQRVTNIVHELNNPLTTILGYAQRIAQREEASAPPGEVRRILQEAERASGIVRQLLDLPRGASPKTELVSLNELVESAVDLQRPTLNGSGLRLEMEIEEGLPRVRGDHEKLQQVLLNLLQNSQQALQESGKGNLLCVRTGRGGPGRVKLEVQDDGPGIPEAAQARIFEPFFTTKPPGKGTGLGLSIVRGFVREHGGTITVRSTPGGGAQFVVELPAAENGPQEKSSEVLLTKRNGHGLQPGAGGEELLEDLANERAPHILVVEYEPTVGTLISDVLREEGMEVDVLTDGEKALTASRGAFYDLAICDMRMPGVDGQAFFEALEAAGNPLRKHILFVTGDEVAPRTQEFLARHDLPHVAKPFRVEELSLAVRSLLWGQPQPAQAWDGRLVANSLGTGRGDEGTRTSTE